MSESNVDQFRIALSADFLQADFSPSYPMFDLSPLQKDVRIQLEYIAPVNGEMSSEALKEFDALIKKITQMGFLNQLPNHKNDFEVQRILKAFVTAEQIVRYTELFDIHSKEEASDEQ